MGGVRGRSTVAAVSVAAALTGCGILVPNHAVTGRAREPADPLTPEQSRAQVLDAAREVVAHLGLPVVDAYFWRHGCDGRGGPPFRGEIRIGYPKATGAGTSDREASAAEIADMIVRLADRGWRPDPRFHSHNLGVGRDGVMVLFGRQNPELAVRNIFVLGECRDVTPKGRADARDERISLG